MEVGGGGENVVFMVFLILYALSIFHLLFTIISYLIFGSSEACSVRSADWSIVPIDGLTVLSIKNISTQARECSLLAVNDTSLHVWSSLISIHG